MSYKEELLRLTKEIKQRLLLEKAFGIDFVSKYPPKKISSVVNPPKASPAPEEIKEPPAGYLVSESIKKDDREKKLDELGKVASTCIKCRLSESRTKVVFGVGNPFTELMFIGEGPGYDEDQQGEPFVGKAGQLLTKIIEAMKFNRQIVYITNMVKCRPPENRTPRQDEMFICFENYLKWQIEWIKPKSICALGNCAAQFLLNTKESISSLRGRFHDYNAIKLMPTFHPAYLLRNPQDKSKCWHDMKKIMKEMGQG
ncbi:MAG TPA: uracil-DNA glycosylase [Candidatus Hypogeohydataceae bacterium YC40]